MGGLALARCAFEAGKAPRFNIVEAPRTSSASSSSGGKGSGWFNAMNAMSAMALAAATSLRPRRLEFQAASVEECCEWAIAVREAIAVAAGKQLAFEDGQ